MISLLVNKNYTRVSPIHWKVKQIERVCHTSKDAKTLILNKFMEDAVFAARQIETLMYGDYKMKIPIK